MLTNKFIESIKKLCKIRKKKTLSGKNIFMEENDKLLLISNEKYMSSRIIGDNNGAEVYVLSNKTNDDRETMIDAYGFKGLFLDKIRPWFLICSIFRSVPIILTENGESILKYEIDGIKCGDLIYDSIIMRFNHKFTLDSLKNKVALREVILMHYTYYCIKELFKKYNPRLFIAQDLVYRDGFISRFARNHGADILLLTTGRPSYFIESKDDIELSFPRLYEKSIRDVMLSLEDDWETHADEELEKLFQGNFDWNAQNAFKDKIVIGREELLDELNINNGKKNIVVMAHCFSDAPHGNGSGYELYKDYYTWLIKTIEIAENIRDVNWLIRSHPSSISYGELGEVEKLCENKENITILSDKYSTLMVARIADCIITVNGSAGIEIPCMGVPCINAGRPFYSNFGFSLCPNSIEEYENTLKRISEISPLTKEQVREAKKVLLLFHRIVRENDDYYDECYKIHQHYCVDKNVESANEEYSELFCDAVEKDTIKLTYNYLYAEQVKI